ANVAAAVHPAARYGRSGSGDWIAVERGEGREFGAVLSGAEMVGWRYRGPFDHLTPELGRTEHRVIPWTEVALDEGTGIVHIAPGCGAEDFDLGRANGLAVLTPVDESGRFEAGFGWLAGMSADEARQPIIDDLSARGILVEAGTVE